MTPAQKLIIKNYVQADLTLNASPRDNGGAYEIATAMNQPATPSFIVWKTSVSIDEIMRNGMNWTRVDNLSVGKARIWDWLSKLGFIDASKINVRAGIDAAWQGTADDLAVRTTIYVHCKRTASLVEKLLATGVGTDISPATMGFETIVNYNDIFIAMGW